MAWISDARLAAAVSQAGGLGILAAGNLPALEVRREIEAVRALTDRPFGLNIMLRSPYTAEVAALAAKLRVPVVTTGAGNPAAFLPLWKEAGCRVLPVVPTVALARRMERLGADAVIAEGTESGGHVGELTTLALVPQVADALSIPVVAAGGIADGRGMAAAMLLGADGIQMGTRFLTAAECGVHPAYQQKVRSARDTSTIVTSRRDGHPVRALKNKMTRRYAEREYAGAPAEELDALGTGALYRAAVEGDTVMGCVCMGQIAPLAAEVLPAAQILTTITREAQALLRKGATLL